MGAGESRGDYALACFIFRILRRPLVAERLAACVNLLPGLRSVYRWQRKVEAAAEVLLLVKTSAEAYPALQERLRQLHPYELPELLAVEAASGLPEYLQWLAAESRPVN
ncbi:divalent-cation tolerance protein CutA [Enterobacter hormaechei subsp. xiangfangensis]|nr:divalent-cation tolerance protein CutA [Enterobacter hormaechei subsp. xiangfangensis]